jgi:hypothetical protein
MPTKPTYCYLIIPTLIILKCISFCTLCKKLDCSRSSLAISEIKFILPSIHPSTQPSMGSMPVGVDHAPHNLSPFIPRLCQYACKLQVQWHQPLTSSNHPLLGLPQTPVLALPAFCYSFSRNVQRSSVFPPSPPGGCFGGFSPFSASLHLLSAVAI